MKNQLVILLVVALLTLPAHAQDAEQTPPEPAQEAEQTEEAPKEAPPPGPPPAPKKETCEAPIYFNTGSTVAPESIEITEATPIALMTIEQFMTAVDKHQQRKKRGFWHKTYAFLNGAAGPTSTGINIYQLIWMLKNWRI